MDNKEVRSSESCGARKVKGSRRGGVGIGRGFGGGVGLFGGEYYCRYSGFAFVGVPFVSGEDISRRQMQFATNIAAACQGDKELER